MCSQAALCGARLGALSGLILASVCCYKVDFSQGLQSFKPLVFGHAFVSNSGFQTEELSGSQSLLNLEWCEYFLYCNEKQPLKLPVWV